MNFEWSDYLELARELAGQTASPAGTEARLRSAISRAYYAAFCKCRNHLPDVGTQLPQGPAIHQFVRDEFKDSTDKKRKKIGNDLDRLRADRNKADYDDSISGLGKMVYMDIELAEQIINALGRL